MIDHISIPVSNLQYSDEFYLKILAPLGFKRLVQRETAIGFGKHYPEFWLNARKGMARISRNSGFHFCLRCKTTEAVDEFHKIALTEGGLCDGAPGPRQAAMTEYYGAFILDLDGHKIEAVCFPQKD
ncbi:lyase [Alphaproteobacteria bacterium 46_93_T64]|mgnify:CR=1 FL=1|nr:lyase [Alphaproteobacteria bacterium 46_93_T64]